METSDGPCVKQNRDRTKLIPSKKKIMEKQRDTNLHTMFRTVQEARYGKNAMKAGRPSQRAFCTMLKNLRFKYRKEKTISRL